MTKITIFVGPPLMKISGSAHVNYDPGMTLTFFMARSTKVAHAFEWGKLLQCHLKGKTCSKLANRLNLYD